MQAVKFCSEAMPFGIVGSTLLDRAFIFRAYLQRCYLRNAVKAQAVKTPLGKEVEADITPPGLCARKNLQRKPGNLGPFALQKVTQDLEQMYEMYTEGPM